MKLRGMYLFYATWIPMCLFSFITSTFLGYVMICLGIMIALLEIINERLRQVLAEQRHLRLELQHLRLRPRDEPS